MKLLMIFLAFLMLMSCKNDVPSAPLEPPPVKSKPKPKPKIPVTPKPNVPTTQLETYHFTNNLIA